MGEGFDPLGLDAHPARTEGLPHRKVFEIASGHGALLDISAYAHRGAAPRKSASALPRARPGSAPRCSTPLELIIVKETAFSLAHLDQPGMIRAVEPIVNFGMSLKQAPAIVARMLGAG